MNGYPKFSPTEIKRYAEPTSPIGGVIWYDAAAYCNWLSETEGIPQNQWCYETNPKGEVTKLKEAYLSLSGYRLPTEAEMEYATRAGASTSRYFGETEELLPKYAWYFKNSLEKAWPVGSLKPNDLGLFDMNVNMFVWSQDSYQQYPQDQEGKVLDDHEDILNINAQDSRVLRGGSFNSRASNVRSANRNNYAPTLAYNLNGFRLTRTIRLVSMQGR